MFQQTVLLHIRFFRVPPAAINPGTARLRLFRKLNAFFAFVIAAQLIGISKKRIAAASGNMKARFDSQPPAKHFPFNQCRERGRIVALLHTLQPHPADTMFPAKDNELAVSGLFKVVGDLAAIEKDDVAARP